MENGWAVAAPQSDFWTLDRVAAARAMRSYRALWAACSDLEQGRLRNMVHRLRGSGVPEGEIRLHVQDVLRRMRPWRMTDGKLSSALRAVLRRRHRGRKRKEKSRKE